MTDNQWEARLHRARSRMDALRTAAPTPKHRAQLREMESMLARLEAESGRDPVHATRTGLDRSAAAAGIDPGVLFQCAPEPYLATDARGVVQVANRAAARLFGRPDAELNGLPLEALVAEPDRALLRRQLALLTRVERVRDLRLSLVAEPAGAPEVVVRASAATVQGTHGSVAAMLWQLRPEGGPGQQLDAEAELVEERAARAEAEAAGRVQSEFLAVMSHELRTPLTAIMGYAELLRMGIPEPLPDALRPALDRIDSSARHLLQLIEEILTFSRTEAGREQVRYVSVDLRAAAEEAAAFARPLAEEEGLSWRMELPREPLPARTDPRKVRQILSNLLSNAVKFTPEGTVSLLLSESGGEGVFVVADTGVGIAPDQRERVWEPFWQAQRGNTREAGGTGLGLTVARRAAELIGARLELSSEIGSGTEVRLFVPLGE